MMKNVFSQGINSANWPFEIPSNARRVALMSCANAPGVSRSKRARKLIQRYQKRQSSALRLRPMIQFAARSSRGQGAELFDDCGVHAPCIRSSQNAPWVSIAVSWPVCGSQKSGTACGLNVCSIIINPDPSNVNGPKIQTIPSGKTRAMPDFGRAARVARSESAQRSNQLACAP